MPHLLRAEQVISTTRIVVAELHRTLIAKAQIQQRIRTNVADLSRIKVDLSLSWSTALAVINGRHTRSKSAISVK